MNRTLEEMLQAFVGPSKEEAWDNLIPCCDFAINNAFNESIPSTPSHASIIADCTNHDGCMSDLNLH